MAPKSKLAVTVATPGVGGAADELDTNTPELPVVDPELPAAEDPDVPAADELACALEPDAGMEVPLDPVTAAELLCVPPEELEVESAVSTGVVGQPSKKTMAVLQVRLPRME